MRLVQLTVFFEADDSLDREAAKQAALEQHRAIRSASGLRKLAQGGVEVTEPFDPKWRTRAIRMRLNHRGPFVKESAP